jgi:phosphoribosylamine--glycine ligase
LQKDNLDYKGFIFIGLMNDSGEPKVIEYNCRLGDPETEVVIPRIKNDLVELLIATAGKKLNGVVIETDERAVATVVAVSGGYPGDYEKGKIIKGLQAKDLQGKMIFHSGTKKTGEDVVTNGGRVLAVTAYGNNITDAVRQSNDLLKQLDFEGMYHRPDIGYEFTE